MNRLSPELMSKCRDIKFQKYVWLHTNVPKLFLDQIAVCRNNLKADLCSSFLHPYLDHYVRSNTNTEEEYNQNKRPYTNVMGKRKGKEKWANMNKMIQGQPTIYEKFASALFFAAINGRDGRDRNNVSDTQNWNIVVSLMALHKRELGPLIAKKGTLSVSDTALSELDGKNFNDEVTDIEEALFRLFILKEIYNCVFDGNFQQLLCAHHLYTDESKSHYDSDTDDSAHLPSHYMNKTAGDLLEYKTANEIHPVGLGCDKPSVAGNPDDPFTKPHLEYNQSTIDIFEQLKTITNKERADDVRLKKVQTVDLCSTFTSPDIGQEAAASNKRSRDDDGHDSDADGERDRRDLQKKADVFARFHATFLEEAGYDPEELQSITKHAV